MLSLLVPICCATTDQQEHVRVLNIDQIVNALEQQRTSIERAIAALRGIAGHSVVHRASSELQTASPDLALETADRTPAGAEQKRSPKRSRKVYTDAFRHQVVVAVRNGMTLGQAAKKFK